MNESPLCPCVATTVFAGGAAGHGGGLERERLKLWRRKGPSRRKEIGRGRCKKERKFAEEVETQEELPRTKTETWTDRDAVPGKMKHGEEAK